MQQQQIINAVVAMNAPVLIANAVKTANVQKAAIAAKIASAKMASANPTINKNSYLFLCNSA